MKMAADTVADGLLLPGRGRRTRFASVGRLSKKPVERPMPP